MTATSCAQVPHQAPTSEWAYKKYEKMAMHLFNKHARLACRTIEDLEDGEQEARAAIVAGLKTYDPDRGASLTTHIHWVIYGAVTHFAANLRTRKCFTRTHDQFNETVHQSHSRARGSSLTAQAKVVYLDDLLEGCTQHQIDLVKMYHVEGLNSTDIALRVGISSNAVRDSIARAYRRIREGKPHLAQLLVA